LAREKAKYNMWIGYALLLSNIVLNFAMIPFLGICGAALASSVTYIGTCGLWIAFYVRESGVSIVELLPRRKDFAQILGQLWGMAKGLRARVRRRQTAHIMSVKKPDDERSQE